VLVNKDETYRGGCMVRGRTEEEIEGAKRRIDMAKNRATPCVIHEAHDSNDVARYIAGGCSDPSLMGPIMVRILYQGRVVEALLYIGDKILDISSKNNQLFDCMNELIPLIEGLLKEDRGFVARYGEKALWWTIR